MTYLLIILFMFIHNTVDQSRILRQHVQQRINCSRIASALVLICNFDFQPDFPGTNFDTKLN